jgi:hypothetical protein
MTQVPTAQNEKEKLVSFLKNMRIQFREEGNRIMILGVILSINKSEIEIWHNIGRIKIIENVEAYRIYAEMGAKNGEISLSKNINIQYKHPELFIDL